jgi:16S rRNA (guanine527-N7)-methyltransferase
MINLITSRESFQQAINVSRETMVKLQIYSDLLEKWTQRINLVSRNSLEDSWHRHFLDSAQIWKFRPSNARHWVDIGAGAGFPGLVLAIIAKEHAPHLKFTLVESDLRKCAFLREVARATETPLYIHADRIETLSVTNADVVSARALAPLEKLLEYAGNMRSDEGKCLFLKGNTCNTEIQAALKKWAFDPEKFTSLTDPSGVVLRIGEFSRARQ